MVRLKGSWRRVGVYVRRLAGVGPHVEQYLLSVQPRRESCNGDTDGCSRTAWDGGGRVSPLDREVWVFVPDGGGHFLKNLMCDQDPEIELRLMDADPHEDAPLQGSEECVGVVDDTEGQSIVQSCVNT